MICGKLSQHKTIKETQTPIATLPNLRENSEMKELEERGGEGAESLKFIVHFRSSLSPPLPAHCLPLTFFFLPLSLAPNFPFLYYMQFPFLFIIFPRLSRLDCFLSQFSLL